MEWCGGFSRRPFGFLAPPVPHGADVWGRPWRRPRPVRCNRPEALCAATAPGAGGGRWGREAAASTGHDQEVPGPGRPRGSANRWLSPGQALARVNHRLAHCKGRSSACGALARRPAAETGARGWGEGPAARSFSGRPRSRPCRRALGGKWCVLPRQLPLLSVGSDHAEGR